jgi:hypothetical protein
MGFGKSENNDSLTPTGNKAYSTVDAGASANGMPPGILASSKPMQANPTRKQMGNPNLTGKLHMPRTKYGSK